MNCGQHVAFGTLLGTGVHLATGFSSTGLLALPSYYGGIVLGSLLPDIDHKQSYLGRRLPFLSAPIQKIFGHRGFTHSILSLTLLGLATGPYWHANTLFFGGLLLGYLSHLLADMTTIMGVPLLYPNKTRYSFLKRGRGK